MSNVMLEDCLDQLKAVIEHHNNGGVITPLMLVGIRKTLEQMLYVQTHCSWCNEHIDKCACTDEPE